MKTYFISRHKAAKEWAKSHGIDSIHLDHLDAEIIENGDNVIGTLPIHLAAKVCSKGADFIYLEMDIPQELRGKELTAQEMEKCNVRLQSYLVTAKE